MATWKHNVGGVHEATFPNDTTTLVDTVTSQTVQNKVLDNTNSSTIKDSSLTIQNTADTTKQLVFSLAGLTTATTRTVTLPDASGTATLLGNVSTGTGSVVLAGSPVLTTPNIGNATGNISGNAATVTTNANLTGVITSVGNATSIASQTGTGSKFVVDTSPTIVTPAITTSINVPIIKPPLDSTTAVQITKADGVTAVLDVDTTNSRIGIGSTPSYPLHVVGSNPTIFLNGSVPSVSFKTVGAGTREWRLAGAYNDFNSISLVDITAGNLQRILVNSSGQVGINNISPSYTLDVTGTIRGTAFIGGAATALTPGVTVSLDPTLNDVFTLSPGGNETINAASVQAGQIIYIVFTSRAVADVITLGTNFKSTGTLTMAGTAGKIHTMSFVSDGTNYNELSRTTGM